MKAAATAVKARGHWAAAFKALAAVRRGTASAVARVPVYLSALVLLTACICILYAERLRIRVDERERARYEYGVLCADTGHTAKISAETFERVCTRVHKWPVTEAAMDVLSIISPCLPGRCQPDLSHVLHWAAVGGVLLLTLGTASVVSWTAGRFVY